MDVFYADDLKRYNDLLSKYNLPIIEPKPKPKIMM